MLRSKIHINRKMKQLELKLRMFDCYHDGACLFGLGYGAVSSVDWALTIDALPSLKEAGKHLGLWNAPTTLPAIIAPLPGSAIINIAGGRGNIEPGYRLVFACATVFLIIAAIGILFVRERR